MSPHTPLRIRRIWSTDALNLRQSFCAHSAHSAQTILTTHEKADAMTNPLLQCRLNRIDIDDQAATVTFHLPRGHCTDFSGAIKLAGIVCPGVRTIHTIAGTKPDTSYLLTRGEWQSLCRRH